MHHTQEISRGFKLNKAKKEHIKGLAYYFKKHRYFWVAPKFNLKKHNNLSVLFLAYHFPPSTGSGSLRPLYFANNLVKRGIGVSVITCKEDKYLSTEKIDMANLDLISDSVDVHRCHSFHLLDKILGIKSKIAKRNPKEIDCDSGSEPQGGDKSFYQSVKDFLTDLLSTPDPQVGWLPYCILKSLKIINLDRPDVVIATGGPWTALLAGYVLKRFKNICLILDFRDPWIANPYFKERGRIVQKLDTYLEKCIVTHSDLVIANTKGVLCDFRKRYPTLPASRFTHIPNGFEAYVETSIDKRNGAAFTITHTGALYYSRNPFNFLQAVENLISTHEIPSANLIIELVGGIDVSNARIRELLESVALKNIVKVIPRVSYEKALSTCVMQICCY